MMKHCSPCPFRVSISNAFHNYLMFSKNYIGAFRGKHSFYSQFLRQVMQLRSYK